MSNRKPNLTHLTGPLDPDARYVVRNADWGRVWGADLNHKDATKLKEAVAGRGLSRTVTLEPMPTDAAQLELCKNVQGLDVPVPKVKTVSTTHVVTRPAAPAPSVSEQPEIDGDVGDVGDVGDDDLAPGDADLEDDLLAALGDDEGLDELADAP